MKNILFVTTMYPTPQWNLDTPVCHYFAKEWRKMGYNVKVIHYQSIFPIFFYWALSLFRKQAARYIGNDNNNTKRRTKDIHFIMDNVPVYSIPIFKLLPHGRFSSITIYKQINKILKLNKSDGFVPDAIIGHFHNPQIEIISKLKSIYSKARTCIVLHERATEIKKTYPKHHLAYMNDIDVWGFRFKSLKEEFESIYGNIYKTFICHSGIPENYINISNKIFESKIKTFCFAGQLIALKRVCDILCALQKAFPLKDFKLNIIGVGMERENLERNAKLLGIQSLIQFWGELSRNDVQKVMSDSDCYVMVSESEAFGLVYLEAMGKGCITIGTRGQGIDGIIQHGINGFLCESKNSDHLTEMFRYIASLSSEELTNISRKAIETAKEMTDYRVAKKYIDTVLAP
jgi:L-malate glycosyltransferase